MKSEDVEQFSNPLLISLNIYNKEEDKGWHFMQNKYERICS